MLYSSYESLQLINNKIEKDSRLLFYNKMTIDYPFQNWNDYYEAFATVLKTENFGYTYPAYHKATQEIIDVDVIIIDSLLKKGLDVQEGFDGFIKTILEGDKYSTEFNGIFPEVLNMFISKGAVPNIDLLFAKNFTAEYIHIQGNSYRISFKDEVCNYPVRGCLIDAFAEVYPGLDVSKYADWKSIEDKDWYETPTKGVYEWNENDRLMYLKSCSEHLRELE